MSIRKFKESEIFWQPYMPEDWTTTRLKFVLTKLNRTRLPESELLVCSNSGEVKKRGDSKLGLVANSDDIYQGVKSGDLLIHGMDTWHGAIAVSTYDGMCTPVVHVCDSNQNKKFISYYLRNMAAQKIFKLISNGVRQNTSDFRSWDKLGNIPIALPPIDEQQKIVRFIESKTLNIDTYVAERERELQLLNELKESEIANVITRGLDPNVKMKSSKIPWLKSIPEHWGEERAKYLFNRENRPITDNDDIITCFRDGQVTLRKNRRTTGFTESFKECGYQGIRKGDLVIHQMDAFAGSVGISDSDGKATPVYIVCTPKRKDIYNPYFALVIREMGLNGYIQSLYRGIRERSSDFKFDVFRQQSLPFPPYEEQVAIVSFIEERTNKINGLITELHAEIEYLKEYKQKLIADCVTGQIKVD